MHLQNPFDLLVRDELLSILATIPADDRSATVLCRLNASLSDQLRFFPAIAHEWRRYLSEAYFEATGNVTEFMFASSTCAVCALGSVDFYAGPHGLEINVFSETGEKVLSTTVAINAAKLLHLAEHNWQLLTGLALPQQLSFVNGRFQVLKATTYHAKSADHVFMHRNSTMTVVLRLKMLE